MLTALARMLNRRPAHLRVIMTGRTEPSLPVNRGRMNVLMVDIDRNPSRRGRRARGHQIEVPNRRETVRPAEQIGVI